MKRKKNLQPWLDYFGMLQRFRDTGLLDVKTDKCEAYIAQSALHAMTAGDDPVQQIRSGAIVRTLRCIRIYAAWLSCQGGSRLNKNFALHVVKNTEPYDLLYTLLYIRKRRWWWPFTVSGKIKTIIY